MMTDLHEASVTEMANDHALLDTCLGQVEELLSPVEESTASALLALLPDVESRCRSHMEYEERGGYFTSIRERAPHLNSVLDELCGEHIMLLTELAEMNDQLRRNEDENHVRGTVGPRLKDWVVKVRNHEHRENTLVQDAFNLDIGVGD